MSLAGSRVSRTADSGIRCGSGIWTMIPETSGSSLSSAIARAKRRPPKLGPGSRRGGPRSPRSGSPGESAGGRPSTARRADDHDGQSRAGRSGDERRDVGLHRARISVAIGAPSEPSAARSRHRCQPWPAGGEHQRLPWLAGHARRRESRRRGARSRGAARRPGRWRSRRTQHRHRRQVHEHVRGRAARRRLAEERRDVEVARRVPVAPPGQCLGGRHHLEARLDARQRDLGRATGGRRHRHVPRRDLVGRLPWLLHRRRECGVRGRVIVGEVEEPGGESPARFARRGVERGVLRVFGAALGERRDHRDEGCRETPCDRRRAAATRHRIRGRQPLDEAGEGQVAEAVGRKPLHPRIVGRARVGERGPQRCPGRPVSCDRFAGPRRRPARASERGERGTGAPAPRTDANRHRAWEDARRVRIRRRGEPLRRGLRWPSFACGVGSSG